MANGDARLRRRQILTLGLMVVGYAGYYLCRSNLSVAMLMIRDDLADRGMDRRVALDRLGAIVSAGMIAYAFGKPFAGALADFLGGRRNFLVGMAGAVACTLAFALGGSVPVFTLAWVGNRLVQSLGWVGMIKITSRWFPPSSYGTVMGIISLSYLFGDAAARAFLGLLIGYGLGWKGLFAVAAGVLAILLLLNAWLLKESPAQLGLPEPRASPASVYGEGGLEPTPPGLRALLVPLLRRPAFWLVCLLSLGCTLLRETFMTWTPTYFVEGVGLGKADAAGTSSVFSLCGGGSVLLAGFLGDRLGRVGRAAIIVGGLALTGLALAVLGAVDFGGSRLGPIALVALVGFLLIGPYSFFAGAISLDFGGKRGGATASGLIDFAGYLGGALAGETMVRVAQDHGWRGAFWVLAAVAWLSAAVAALFLLDQRRAVNTPAAEAGDGPPGGMESPSP